MEGEHRTRYELDSNAETAVRTVRLIAAVLVAGGAAWIMLGGPGLLGWIIALLGAAAALGWAAAFFLSRRRTARSDQWFLELRGDRMVLAEGPRQHHVRWTDVEAVEVDEERLVVRMEIAHETPLIVEPRYRGVGVYDLCEAIDEAWRGADVPGHD